MMLVRRQNPFLLYSIGFFLCFFPVQTIQADPQKDESPPTNHINFRVGASSANQNNRPQLCLELAPLATVGKGFDRLTLEGCGTGAGFLHNDPLPELAHFRSKFRVSNIKAGKIWIQPSVGFGFAELQLSSDDAGFSFSGTDGGISTAGPELSGTVRALFPYRNNLEFIAEFGLTGAFLPHASELLLPQNTFQPSAEITFGIGF